MFHQTISYIPSLFQKEFDLSSHSFHECQSSGCESEYGNVGIGDALSKEEGRDECDESGEEDASDFSTHVDGRRKGRGREVVIVIVMMMMRVRMTHVHTEIGSTRRDDGDFSPSLVLQSCETFLLKL